MKILVAYASRFGTTESCAITLADILSRKGNEVELIDLKNNAHLKPDNYDIVVIGGSFIASKMNTFVEKFVKRNLNTLLNKKIGIFMCGAVEDWENEIKKSFPAELLDSAIAKGYFGYEMNWDSWNFRIRNIMKKASKITETISKINTENIKKFAEELLSKLKTA